MVVEPELQEAEDVEQVGLPVPLGIGVDGQDGAREFAGDLLVEQPLVAGEGAGGLVAEDGAGLLDGGLVEQPFAPALAVGGGLGADGLGLGDVELFGEHGVAGRDLVDGGGAVAHPLPRHEDGHLGVELELHHLEG